MRCAEVHHFKRWMPEQDDQLLELAAANTQVLLLAAAGCWLVLAAAGCWLVLAAAGCWLVLAAAAAAAGRPGLD